MSASCPRCGHPQQCLPHHSLQGTGPAGAKHGVNNQAAAGQQGVKPIHILAVSQIQDSYFVGAGQVQLGINIRTGRQQAGGYFRAPPPQVTGGHQAVGAIVAGADKDDYRDAGNYAQPLAGVFGHGQAGVFHEGVGAGALPLGFLLQGSHLGGGDYLEVSWQIRHPWPLSSGERGEDCSLPGGAGSG